MLDRSSSEMSSIYEGSITADGWLENQIQPEDRIISSKTSDVCYICKTPGYCQFRYLSAEISCYVMDPVEELFIFVAWNCVYFQYTLLNTRGRMWVMGIGIAMIACLIILLNIRFMTSRKKTVFHFSVSVKFYLYGRGELEAYLLLFAWLRVFSVRSGKHFCVCCYPADHGSVWDLPFQHISALLLCISSTPLLHRRTLTHCLQFSISSRSWTSPFPFLHSTISKTASIWSSFCSRLPLQ